MAPDKVTDPTEKYLYIYYFSTKIYVVVPIEAPRRDASNEYLHDMFLWIIYKNIMRIPLLSRAVTYCVFFLQKHLNGEQWWLY